MKLKIIIDKIITKTRIIDEVGDISKTIRTLTTIIIIINHQDLEEEEIIDNVKIRESDVQKILAFNITKALTNQLSNISYRMDYVG